MSQLYISIKDGYSCKKQNPNVKPSESEYYKRKSEGISWGDYLHKKWSDFELTSPELPLTEHVEVGKVFEGEIVHGSMGGTRITEVKPIHPTQTVGEGEKEKDEWISVEDDILPPFEIKTQIICADGEQYIGYYNGADNKGDCWFCDNNDYHYPTHWMLLPSPPKIS